MIPGVRLNFSKSGVGYSVGGKGVRYTKRADGRSQVSARVPGTNARYTSTSSSPGRNRAQSAPTPRPRVAKPGLTAPKSEKLLYNALHSGNTEVMEQVLQSDQSLALAAASLATVRYLHTGHYDRAHQLAEWAFGTGRDPAADPFIVKYGQLLFTLNIVPGVTAELGLDRSSLGLLLAEFRQSRGDINGAIHAVEQLEPTTFAALSLAELYVSAGRYGDAVELTNGLTNSDDVSALLMVFRGAAFREAGRFEASRESLKEALKSKKRSPEIRHRALFERALTYEAEGKKGMARKDLERILAEDSRYPGLAERLALLDQP